MASAYRDSTDDDGPITDINVTPFVDVVLVLLVIFMVTARLIITRGVEGIERPASGAGGPIEAPLRVSVDAAGVLYVGAERFDADDAATARVRELVAATAAEKVIVTGDARTAYGGVMRAISVVRAAGVAGIALENTSP